MTPIQNSKSKELNYDNYENKAKVSYEAELFSPDGKVKGRCIETRQSSLPELRLQSLLTGTSPTVPQRQKNWIMEKAMGIPSGIFGDPV